MTDCKAQHLLNSIKVLCGNEVYNEIVASCGVLPEDASREQLANYIKNVLSELEGKHGPELAAQGIKPCGHQCIANSTIEAAKATLEQAKDIPDFLRLLNEKHIGGGKLHIRGEDIIAVYDQCYCDIPSRATGMPQIYCNCSVGWFEKLFSAVFERDIEVRSLQTILGGASNCTFAIRGIFYAFQKSQT